MERGESSNPGTDMVGQGGDVEIDAFPGVAFALPVERLVLPILLEQDHRQQAGADSGTRDDVEGSRRLRELLAIPAGELFAHGLPHKPAAWDDVEGLGNHLADLGEPAAPAALARRRRRHDQPLARQMRRQRPACRLLPEMGCNDRAGSSFRGRLVLGGGFLDLGQLELELVDEPLAALAGLPELLAPRHRPWPIRPRSGADPQIREGRAAASAARSPAWRPRLAPRPVAGRCARPGSSRAPRQGRREVMRARSSRARCKHIWGNS